MANNLTARSSRTLWIDALSPDRASVLVQVLAISSFAVATALGAQVRIYLWEVPITLQTLFVYGSGLVLGARNGLLSMLLYLVLGMFLPVYAGRWSRNCLPDDGGQRGLPVGHAFICVCDRFIGKTCHRLVE